MARIRRVDTSEPGWTRRRCGRGFTYLDAEGERIADPRVRQRLKELAIPPAWEEVWISPDPHGHIQATGRDAADRKQYLYHQRWRELRDEEKFADVLAFARRLPRVRARIAADLDPAEPSRRSVLACAARMLDHGSFRVGGEGYASEHGTFGLSTVQKQHVSITADAVVFDYPGKHGKRRRLRLEDAEVRALVQRLRRRRGGGEELLAYRDGGRWRDVRSEDVNDYVKQIAGEQFTAKAFRTWNATLLAALALAAREPGPAASQRERHSAMLRAIEDVAELLGHTPQVCRDAYVHPRLLERFERGETVDRALELAERAEDLEHDLEALRAKVERRVVEMLADEALAEEPADRLD